jgi:hypothetical protein
VGVLLFTYHDIYFYNITLDYKEYVSGRVIDKDYTNFGDLLGVGYKFEKNYNRISYFVRIEFAAGESNYKGSTWDGTPVSTRQKGVYIFNTEGGAGFRNFNLVLGYREWKRGKSDFEGDYDEVYYWPYFGVRYKYEFYFKNFAFLPEFGYQMAINPKMKVKLGNQPVLDLGETQGYKLEFPLIFRKDNFYFKVFYRYQFWHINRSDYEYLIVGSNKYVIYEPESITANQYFGIGLLYKF